MRFPRFVDAVSRRSGLPPEQAAAIARAVLQTMAERVTGGEADDLAGQLPDELGDYLAPGTEAIEGRSAAFGPAAFLRRVGERAGVDEATARVGAGAVFATLRQAVTVGEFREMVARLPRGLDGTIEPVPPYDG
ncbi:Uncharacterized conserved protein, DUF2267 family [Micromonospora echinaurantiaca]|uniref:Uncharacterized conserved protein, DUF2267 family n=1 Tax=Micromonospora echinaurantiaca TaxID=47857 RepID=A0A1C5IDY1_9ACTN|nr:DUF2267 domain-containing protein [Micromonospora echinaurantiaca]SCG56395.1 Uncharacterized conserved protein, DUF2267 family [Micromonospora echinaurantiaca]